MKKRSKINVLNKNQLFRQQKESSLMNIVPELFIVSIFLIILTMTSIFFSTFRYYQIRQNSMQPLFNNYESMDINDGVFVRVNSGFEVGDIIVLKYDTTSLIKRVVATGGDKIAVVRKDFNGRVEYLLQRIAKDTSIPYTLVEPYINDQDPLGMKKVYDAFQSFMATTSANKETYFDGDSNITYLVLEEDEVFYLGDNRGSSLDSSKNGPVHIDDVIGKVEIVVWKEENFLFNILAYFLGFKNI